LRPDELKASHDLAVLCFGEGVGADQPVAGYAPAWRDSVEVFVHRGAPVAQIGVFHSRLNVCGSQTHIASIGGVGTHPDYRGMGLGTRLLDHCTRKLVAEGACVMLISGTRGLYRRAGCVPAQIFRHVVWTGPQDGARLSPFTVRPATEADARQCAMLYQMEPVHLVRCVEEFERRLRCRVPDGRLADNWIIEQASEPVAYMLTAVPWGKSREDGVHEMGLLGEYAGDRSVLLTAIDGLLANPELRELRLAVPWWDRGMLDWITPPNVDLGWSVLTAHTMRIVNWPGLMRDLRLYVAQRLTRRERRGLRFEQAGDRFAITRGRGRLEFDGMAITRLVLGVPQGAEDLVPVPADGLGEVVRALFPLPSFIPGLNAR